MTQQELIQPFNLSVIPEILDITAGYRNIWNGKHDNVLFLDKRCIVKPNVVANNEMLPFRDKSFKKIVYDPPHLIRSSPLTETCFMKKYEKKFTVWKKKSDFLKNLIGVDKEVFRVLADDGLLIIKHTNSPDNPISRQVVINIFEHFQLIKARDKDSVGWGNSTVSWLNFVKKDELLVKSTEEAK